MLTATGSGRVPSEDEPFTILDSHPPTRGKYPHVAMHGELCLVGRERMPLGLEMLRDVELSGDLGVIVNTVRILVDVSVDPHVRVVRLLTLQRDELAANQLAGHCTPIQSRHIPRLAKDSCTRVARQLDGTHRDPVRLNVVGVTISAVGVVSNDNVGANLSEYGSELASCYVEVGLPEGISAVVARGAHAPRVAITPLTSEIAMVVDSKRRKCVSQLS